MKELTGTSVPRLARGVRLREDHARGRWVVLAPERMLVPDATAIEVLRLLDGTRTVDVMVEELAVRYAAPRDEIAADVLEMLRELAEKGVVTT